MRAGLDVTFIEQWPAHAEAMRTNGVWVVMPDETLVTHVRAVHSGGSGGDWMKGRRGAREDINGLSSCGSSCRAPVNEALIAARIEGGVLSALPSDADLQSSALGAWGGLCK